MNNIHCLIVNHACQQLSIDCVRSLRSYCGQEVKVSIADNSPDSEIEKLTSGLQDVNTIRLGENKGFAHAINALNAKFSSDSDEFLLILNPDTYCNDDFLTPLLNQLLKSPSVAAASPTILKSTGSYWYAGGKFSWLKGGPIHFKSKPTTNKPTKVKYVSCCALLIRRKVFEKLGGLPEEYFLYFEDADLSLSILKADYELVWVPEAKIFHHVSATTDSKSTMYVRLFARNRIWLMRKRSSGLKLILFYSIFFLLRFPAAIFYFVIILKKPELLLAFIKGVREGLYFYSSESEKIKSAIS